jgi:hypothetical protein
MVDTTTFSYTGNTTFTSVDAGTYSFSPTRIGDLYLYGKDKKNKYMYVPQDDITVLELSLIMRLFISALLSSRAYYDYWGYVKEHNLERHFVEE